MRRSHLFSLILGLLLLAVPGSSWAQTQTYISEIVVGDDDNAQTVQEKFKKEGYTTDNHDMNSGAGGRYSYLGWKTTANPDSAITNIVVRKGGDNAASFKFSDGRTYYLAKVLIGHGDLNKDADGDYIYLYYSRENPERGVVKSIKYEGTNSNCSSPIYMVEGTEIKDYAADFNSGTKGNRIYYSISKEVVVGKELPKLEQEFKAEDLGGGFYKVTAPLGCKEDNDLHIFGGNGASGAKLYATLQDDKEYEVFKIKNVSEHTTNADDFSGRWCYEVPAPASTTIKDSIYLVNPQTLQAYTLPIGSSNELHTEEGNDVDLRLVTWFIRVKPGLKISKFRLYGDVVTNRSGKRNKTLDMKAPVNAPDAPEGMNNIVVTDPMLDFNAGKAGSTAVVGSQLVNVVPAGKMKWAGVWDNENQNFIFAGDVDEKNNQLTYHFPQVKSTTQYTLLLWGENRMTTTSGMSSNNGWFAIPLTIYPFHVVDTMSIDVVRTKDEQGVFKQVNHINWNVTNVRQQDVFDTDFYLVQRSQLPDFSDAVTIITLPVSVEGVDSTMLKVTQRSMTEDVGRYTVVDDMEGNNFNDNEHATSKKLYYRVIRAVYLANWGEDKNETFSQTDSLNVNTYLAELMGIYVNKTPSFEQESRVELKVTLTQSNPGQFSKDEEFNQVRSRGNLNDVTVSKGTPVELRSYYIISAREDRYLSLKGGKVHLSHEPFLFSFTKQDGKYVILGENGEYLGWDGSRTPQLVSGSTQCAFDGVIETRTDAPSYFLFSHTDDQGVKRYVDDGYFCPEEYRWNVVHSYYTSEQAQSAYWTLHNEYTMTWDPTASISIHRFSPQRETRIDSNGDTLQVDLAEKDIVISGDKVKWDKESQRFLATVEDIQSYPLTKYYYRATLDDRRSKIKARYSKGIQSSNRDADSCWRENIAPIANLKATMGTLKGGVAIEWDIEEGALDSIKLERREVKCKETTSVSVLNYLAPYDPKSLDPIEYRLISVAPVPPNYTNIYVGMESGSSKSNIIPTSMNARRMDIRFLTTGNIVNYNGVFYATYILECHNSGSSRWLSYICKASPEVSLFTPGDNKLAAKLDKKDEAVEFILVKPDPSKEDSYLALIPCENGVASDYKCGFYPDDSYNYSGTKWGLIDISTEFKYRFTTSSAYWQERFDEFELNGDFRYPDPDPLNQNPYEKLDLKNVLTTNYLDKGASSGKLYEYKVTAQLTAYGTKYESSRTVYGWNPYFGTVKGKISLKNNKPMPAKVRVNIKGQDTVKVASVYNATKSELLIPEYNNLYQNSIYTTDGTFEFDSIPYLSGGTPYQLEIAADGAEFVLEGQEDDPIAQINLKDSHYAYDSLHYVCNDTRQFSGRVLYQNSTIPVQGCEFEMNGCKVLDSNGKPLVTDSKGEFSFLLPVMPMTLRAVKDGHVFADGGYVEGRNDDKIPNKEHQFVPTANYDGLILTDNTTIRLVGRLIGGGRQGKLPVGMGLSKNNLGDHMRVVLELEGDNTSRITYFKDNPDRSSYEKEFSQDVTITNVHTIVEQLDKTKATFEKKRIVIEPDVKTGEFCIDLPPAKYKVTELSAKGYSTLFNEGEGFQVLDLSHSDTCHVSDTCTYLNEDIHGKETRITNYNARYQRVVHNPVSITYEQHKYGMKQNILGEENMNIVNVVGKKTVAKIAEYDKNTKTTTYMFGKPVFFSGVQYELHAYAHEDFYYNGDTLNTPDVVYLEGDTLRVTNGLVSGTHAEVYPLDSVGHTKILFVASNPEFTLNEKDALRYLNMQVVTNGYYYEGNPLKAFVTGVRNKGKDVTPLASVNSPIKIVDVLRDPYGSGSYTYRERGTHYHWDYSEHFNIGVNMDIKVQIGTKGSYFTGLFTGMGAGAVAGTTSGASNIGTINLPIPLIDLSNSWAGEYDMTLNDKISTSSDPLDVGAMADVYMGFVDTYNLYRMETFSIIDQETYNYVKPAIESGAIRIVQKGKDGNYLAISEQLTVGPGKQKNFVYTQKHILGTIIPQLVQDLEKELLVGDSTEIQKMANESKKLLYWLKTEGDPVDPTFTIVAIYPRVDHIILDSYEKPEMSPVDILETIRQWAGIIEDNERRKYELINSADVPTRYSLSSATKIDHSESASAFYKTGNLIASFGGVAANGSYAGSWRDKIGGDLGGSIGQILKSDKGWDLGVGEFGNKPASQTGMNRYNSPVTATVDLPGYSFKFDFLPDLKFNYDRNKSKKTTITGGSGYVLETNDNGYLDIDVYRTDDYKVDEQFINTMKSSDSEKGDGEFDDDFWDDVTDDPNSENVKKAKLQDYVFTVRGGAERGPWYEPDSTLFYTLDGSTPLPLTTRTLRIDNPKITINDPVVSNLPVGEKAIFSVKLTNDSEVTSNMDKGLMNASLFKLFLDEKSCPDGLAFTIDGVPLAEGRTFRLKPGESMTKTIQVERAGKPYDYENIRLGFRDDANSLVDYASISVHYLPSSTPLKMVQPIDKWVMNTLAAQDEEGRYYLPIEVNGFDINYDNFDHIELQYKKKTEGDSKWVNMCSFYANDSLYNVASGTKEKLNSGTISYRFYGEADPVEMEYDLRAVSFCRLGSGYVTAASNVMSGLKDTRTPEIFGKAKPTNGVLTFEDVISFPFNEPIAYNYLDKTANFQIMGLTNDMNKTYDTSLRFDIPKVPENASPGDTTVLKNLLADFMNNVPTTEVKRNITGKNFTIDMMTRLDPTMKSGTFFQMMDRNQKENKYYVFGVSDSTLTLSMNGVLFRSKNYMKDKYADYGLSLNKPTLSHVAVSFLQPDYIEEDDDKTQQVHFYIDGTEIDMEVICSARDTQAVYYRPGKPITHRFENTACGEICVGSAFVGNITDVRLWDKVLSQSEIESKKGKILSNNQPGLMCYWPIDEMAGNILHEKVNGADMHFTRQTWQMPTGQHSLKLEGEGVTLVNTEIPFMRSPYTDYTLSFWTRIDGGATLNDSVTVFNAGTVLDKQHFAIYLNPENVMLRSGNYEAPIAKREQLADGKWHLLTAVTNKSENSSSVYLDGKLSVIAKGEDFNGMSNEITLGDPFFYGGFDNLSFWHLAVPSNSLSNVSNVAPTGREMGLAYYLPFEMDQVNSQNIHESVFCPYNMVVKKDEEGKELKHHDTALPEEWLTDENLAKLDNSASYPPVKSYGVIQNIPFSWTSTNNELQVNLNIRDAEINHQYVNITIRDVEDLAGNTLGSPQMMRVYVDRNVLNWDDTKLNLSLNYGEKGSITSKLINKSGRTIAFQLENNCTWLKLSQKVGTSAPLSYDNIDMEISDGLAPGEYSTTVYAVDEDNLSTPLTVNVTVNAEEPEWEVTTDPEYQYTMNLMGRVKLTNEGGQEYYDTNTRDIVAAFYNGVCLGKANITVGEDNTPLVNMTILGTKAMNQGKQVLTFQLWQADANSVVVVLPNTADNAVRFQNNAMVGCPPEKPVIFSPTNEVKQTISLEKGWNWVSFNIQPKNDRGINGLFESNEVFTPGDQVMHNTSSSELQLDTLEQALVWSEPKDAIDNSQKLTYSIYVQKPAKVTVFGYAYENADRYVTLKGDGTDKAKWNDLAYLLTVDQPINVAMSDYAKDRAPVGTIIKNRKEFAVMNENGNWVGSLQFMRPGQGYFVKHNSKEDVRILYTNTEKTSYIKRKAQASDEMEEALPQDASGQMGLATLANTSEARTMMPVIADLDDTVELLEGDEILAYAKGNVVGRAQLVDVQDGRMLLFVALNAEDGDVVRFAQVREGETVARSSNGLTYNSNIVAGTLDEPFLIDFSGRDSGNEDAYHVSGIKYGKAADLKHQHGVFIIGEKKIAK